MSLKVILYDNFSKKLDSTKTPSGDVQREEKQCTLKTGCTILHPVMSFKLPFDDKDYWPTRYNYARVQEFGRYYFIRDWEYTNGLWWAYMDVDALASWSSQIKASQQYVMRTNTLTEDGSAIPDAIYPATFDITTNFDQITGIYDTNEFGSGTFVMGIADGGANSRGGITYWCGSQSMFTDLFKFLYGTTDWLGGLAIDDISNDLLKCLVDPGQYIKSMMWFPFFLTKMQGAAIGHVGAGWWETDVTLRGIASSVSVSKSVSRRNHPQASVAKSYLNFSPYTEMEIFVPPFGKVQLPPEKFPVGSDILVSVHVDAVSGQGTLFVRSQHQDYGSGVVLKAQVGVPVSVTTIVSDVLGAAGTVLHSATSGGLNIAANVIGAIGGIMDAAKLLSPDVSVAGGNGNIADYTLPSSITYRFKKIVSTTGHLGFPLCRTVLLSSVPGYNLVANSELEIPCMSEEAEIIKNFLENGFHVE